MFHSWLTGSEDICYKHDLTYSEWEMKHLSWWVYADSRHSFYPTCPLLTCTVLQLHHVISWLLVFVLIRSGSPSQMPKRKESCMSHVKVAAPIYHGVCQLVSLNQSWWPSHDCSISPNSKSPWHVCSRQHDFYFL